MFYQREGFRDATIEASVNRLEFGDRIRVEFEVQEGNPTHIRHFRYNGLDDLTDREKRELRSQSLIPLGTAIDGDQLAWRVETLRYSEPLLVEERQRLIGYLRNEGFADVNRNAIHAVVYPVSPDSFDVTIDVALGTPLQIRRC